jgi:hypothetical protein
MPVTRDIFKKRYFVCPSNHRFEDYTWSSSPSPECSTCGSPTEETDRGGRQFAQAPSVIGDEIDIEIRHGVVNDDGSPRRFRSRAELRKAASEKGLVIAGETPNPTSQQKEEKARWVEETNKKWANWRS